MKLAPIVIFSYNRANHLKKTLISLKKNKLSKKSNIIFFSDGIKIENKADLKRVRSVKKIIKNLKGFKNKKIYFHNKNIGLKKNILDGVTKIVKKYKKIIVLEDDIIVSEYFLNYMNQALDYYKNKKKVWHISGWNYELKFDDLEKKDGETFFIKNMNCWGWGTWHDRWKKIIVNPDFFIKKMNKKKIYDFNLSNSANNWSQLIRNKKKILNTWAIFWNATIFYHKGLCLNPVVSMTKNIGLDGSGSNSSFEPLKKTKISKEKFFIFSKKIKENFFLRNKIIFSLKRKKNNWKYFIKKILSIFFLSK